MIPEEPIGNANFPFGQDLCWFPDNKTIAESNLSRFLKKLGLDTILDLQDKASKDINWFWDAVLDDLGIEFYEPYSSVFEQPDGPEFPVWCADGKMNIVHNTVDKWAANEVTRDKAAIVWETEDGTVETLTYIQLYAQVCIYANALSRAGVGKGDVVALFMPMNNTICVALLAIAKIGAVILPLFSGYGASAISTRLQDAEAKLVFCSDGSHRRGKVVPMKETLDAALEDCRTVETVVVVPTTLRADVPLKTERDITLETFLKGCADELDTAKTAAEDVVMIIYTSGTTGRPKGAVHTHCGFPIKAAQDMHHCMDVSSDSIVYWMSDMGWMMGPWLVFGSLTLGATMIVYDGAPDFPDKSRLWNLVQRHQISHLGISPVLIRALMDSDSGEGLNLNSLKMIGSTGSPWDPASWRWLFNNVLGSEKPIINYSGGTEISGGIICGNFSRPLAPCAFSGPVPGMIADVVDENGASITGEVGELVIRKPWIGMTRGFWKDRERYLQSYWRKIPGVWVHGDFAAVDRHGLWYILGRSDDTIKVAGKRVGPAEVEAIANANLQVRESAAIGVPDETKGEALIVYCVLVDGVTTSDSLRNTIAAEIANELGKPLKPREVLFVTKLPKTRNSKVMRRLIKAAYLGKDLGNTSALEDPDTLRAVRNPS